LGKLVLKRTSCDVS